MIWRRFSLTLVKYTAILLCLTTVLLTTPWGTKLTLTLLNNIDGVAIDYHSGSFVQEIKLHAFDLQLEALEISIIGLSMTLDFSCGWQKTLCIKSLKADNFTLHYTANEEPSSLALTEKQDHNQLIEMPFAIEVNHIELVQSHLVIDKTEIAIEQFTAQLTIKKSNLNLLNVNAKKLTSLITEDKPEPPKPPQNTAYLLENPFAKLPDVALSMALPIALNIEQLHITDIIVATTDQQTLNCQAPCQQQLTEQWHSSNNRLSGSWLHTDISISQLQTSTATFSINSLVAQAQLTPPYKIDSQFVSQLNNLPWLPEMTNTTQKISLQGTLDDLTLDMKSEGSLVLTSQGRVNLMNADTPFNVTMAVEKMPMPLALLPYGESSSLSLTVSGSLKEQTIKLTSQLKSGGYQKAQVKLIASHQQGLFSIKELVFDDSDTASQLNLQGEVNLRPTQIAWQLSAYSSGLSLPKINIQGLAALGQNQQQIDLMTLHLPETITGRLQGHITSTGQWADKQWSLSISDTEISGLINDSALNIEADIKLNHTGQLQKSQLFIAFNDSELTLQTAGNSFWNINGQLVMNNINHWVKGVNGGLTSNFSITGKKDNPVIDLTSKFTQLSWQDYASTSLKVDANYQPMSGHQIKLTISNEQLKWESINKRVNLNKLVVKVDGNANKHQIQTHWLGDFTGQFSLEGQLNQSLTRWQSLVKQGELTYQHLALITDKSFPLTIDLTQNLTIIGSHCWQGKGARICLPNAAVIGNSGDVAINVDLDLGVIDELILPEDLELTNKITGDINARWSKNLPISAEASFSLSPGDLKVIDDFGQHQLSQWSQGDFSFVINEQQLKSTLQLRDQNDKTLIDIKTTLEFIDDYPINSQLKLNQFNLQPFQTLLADVVNLQGKLTANLVVEGTVNSPLINGGITLNTGKLLLRQNANTVDNINTSITIKNNKAKIQGRFFIADQEAQLTGDLAWQKGLSMNINLNAHALPLVFPPYGVISISPTLNFYLKEKTLSLTGNIEVVEGSLTLEKLPQGSVSLSDDVIIVDQQGKAIVKASSGFDLKTAIRVNISKAFKLSGQGVQTHLYGELQISQQEKQPLQLVGKIQSDNGTFAAYGQKLQLEKAELTFNGPIANPYVNLRANRQIKAEDIEVGIEITGLADALNTQLYSSSTMQRPEILSYLIRGRGLDAGTGNSSAAASLLVGFGATNSRALFKQLEKLPLISDISLDTEGEGSQTQATVSGYLGNRVHLKYGIGVYEPINELTVRMYLFNRFWLEIVSGIEQSTDLYYSFDID